MLRDRFERCFDNLCQSQPIYELSPRETTTKLPISSKNCQLLLHRARPKIKIVSTKSNVVVGDLLSLYPIVRECVRIVFVKKMRRFILHINKNIYFCIAQGEKSLGQECVSCFIPYIEIANFKQRDEDNVTLILFVYHRYSPRCTYMVYTTAWGICFSVHFCDGVWRCLIYDERDKSLRFSCTIQANIFIDC